MNERLTRGDAFQKQAGGAELNVVSGVSLLGLRTGIISKVPAKDLGHYIQNRVRFCGVSDDFLVYDNVNFRGNLWTGEEAKACIETILPYVDVFFCSEETARLTFGKEGTVQEMMKSFTKDYNISVVASTQRIVHSPKVHSFGSCVYDAINDRFVQEKAYENIDVVDRSGDATAAVKNTIPGDLPSSNLKEIDSIIKNHQSTGPQLEMNR